jgi:signal transduction histidine kinase
MFKNIRIRTKILILTVFLVLAPLAFSTFSTMRIFRRIMTNKTVSYISGLKAIADARAENLLNNMESCANMLVVNLNRQIGRDVHADDPLAELIRRRKIGGELSNACLIFNEADSAVFIDPRGMVYSTDLLLEDGENLGKITAAARDLWHTGGAAVWLPAQEQTYLEARTRSPATVLGKEIINIDTGRSLGVLLLSLKESELRPAYSEYMAELDGEAGSTLAVIGIIAAAGLLLAYFAAFTISGLIARKEQKKLRRYELDLMQAQIKPHFLYNTLDAIYVLEKMGRREETLTVTMALANFYRSVLSRGDELITVEEEIGSVRDYLNIMKIRYQDLFDYTVETDPAISGCGILKLTVQPLVENAIYHGIKERGAYGKLAVRGFAAAEGAVIEVEDNGVGFQTDMLRARPSVKDGSGRAHFGINNVNERIKMYFGERYGLTVASAPGRGSVVRVTLPGAPV